MAEEALRKLNQIDTLIKEISKKYPATTKAFLNYLKKAVGEKGVLSVKEKELIALALGIATGCEWCIVFHTKNALEAGATPDELIEAGFVAVAMAGGPALMHFIPLMEAIEMYKAQKNNSQ